MNPWELLDDRVGDLVEAIDLEDVVATCEVVNIIASICALIPGSPIRAPADEKDSHSFFSPAELGLSEELDLAYWQAKT